MILLDTHALLWLALSPARLSRQATAAIRKSVASGGLGVASISLWEVAMLVALGRVAPRGAPDAWIADLIDRTGVIVKDLTPTVAVLSTQFPPDFSRDPADRLIGATARAEGLPLVTRDRQMQASPLLKTIW